MPHKKLNFTLIVADDDRDDQVLIRDALQENGVGAADVEFVNDGVELLDRLKSDKKLPGLIILDLNMPRKDGREALVDIRTDSVLKYIPVVIFSTSSSEDDIRNAYDHGSNTFFTKPAIYQELVDLFGTIKHYWLESALTVR